MHALRFHLPLKIQCYNNFSLNLFLKSFCHQMDPRFNNKFVHSHVEDEPDFPCLLARTAKKFGYPSQPCYYHKDYISGWYQPLRDAFVPLWRPRLQTDDLHRSKICRHSIVTCPRSTFGPLWGAQGKSREHADPVLSHHGWATSQLGTPYGVDLRPSAHYNG